MADISRELEKILQAKYGEEVRGSIHDALEKMNENAEAAEEWATGGSGGTPSATNNAAYYATQAAASAAVFDLDDTLSITGKAADSKAVGDAVRGISSVALKDVANTNSWTVGSLAAADASNLNNATNRLRMDNKVSVDDGVVGLKALAGYEFLVYVWDGNTYEGCLKEGYVIDKTASNYLWLTSYIFESGYSYRVVLRNANNPSATMVKADGENCLYTIAKTDTTLSVLGEAADAKTTGDVISAINAKTDEIFKIGIIDGFNLFRGMTMIPGKAVTASTGRINANSISDCTGFVPVKPGHKIIFTRPVTTAGSVTTGMAFYTSNDESSFISGSGIANKTGGTAVGFELYVAEVPATANYACFSWWNDTTRANNGINQPFFVYDLADYINVYGGNVKTSDVALPLNLYSEMSSGGIFNNGNVSTSSAYDHTDYIDISGVEQIIYTRPKSTASASNFGMAFYDSSKAYISDSWVPAITSADSVGYEMSVLDVPDGATYARFSYWNATYQETYGINKAFLVYDYSAYSAGIQGELFGMKKDIEDIKERQPADQYSALGLHTMPPNEGVLNVIKRCRQFTDIRWTPAVDLPRVNMVSISPPENGLNPYYEGVFKAGVEYKGLPYGNCLNYKPAYGKPSTYVGIDIGFDSFITSVCNPDSIVCEESAYITSPYHRGIVYAAVCSSLACYALDVPYAETGNIPDISGISAVCKVVDSGVRMDLKTLRLGDLLNQKNHHVSIVTDLVKDSNGDVVYVEVSEATTVGNGNQAIEGGQYGGICRRIAFDVETFFWRYNSYTVLRYSGIANVTYTKSPYVDIGDEIPMNPYTHLPCMPYEGEGFVYKAGYIPSTKILVSCPGYAYMRVFKNGTEMASSPFSVGVNDEYIEVGFSEVGDYSAYLCNMSGGSDTSVTARCHWKVISAE